VKAEAGEPAWKAPAVSQYVLIPLHRGEADLLAVIGIQQIALPLRDLTPVADSERCGVSGSGETITNARALGPCEIGEG